MAGLELNVSCPNVSDGLVFGTDGSIGKSVRKVADGGNDDQGTAGLSISIEKVLQRKAYYQDWLEALNVPEELQYKIMYDNAAELFGLPKRAGAVE